MLTFLIMAGGSGERFWPLSTKQKPKQLLKIFSDKSLIRLTYERVLPLVDKSNIFIATNEIQVESLKDELPEIDDSRIIIEPAFRDTTAAIAYGSIVISKYYDDPTICVLASDHLIANDEEFRRVISIAAKEAEKDHIITLGIKPSYPETGYGYIEVSDSKLNNATKCIGFKEKPIYNVAKQYYDSGRYLWNSGMFIFTYSTIMEALKEYDLNNYLITEKINTLIGKNNGIETANKVRELFLNFEKKSIDFSVMEKAKNILVIPSEFGWNDVGNYLAFDELFEKDKSENVIIGVNYISVDSYNNIIVSTNKSQRLSTIGIKNCIIAITEKDVLVCEKSRNQEIKDLLKKLSSGSR